MGEIGAGLARQTPTSRPFVQFNSPRMLLDYQTFHLSHLSPYGRSPPKGNAHKSRTDQGSTTVGTCLVVPRVVWVTHAHQLQPKPRTTNMECIRKINSLKSGTVWSHTCRLLWRGEANGIHMSSISWLLLCKIILTLVLAGLLQFSKGSSRSRPACNLGWHILCERGCGTRAYQHVEVILT